MRSQIIIQPHERAILLRDSQPERWLSPGAHTIWHPFSRIEVTRLNVDRGFAELTPELACVLPEEAGVELVVPAEHLATGRKDGRPAAVLEPGRYVLFQLRAHMEAELHNLEGLIATIPAPFWPMVPHGYLQVTTVQPWQRGLLYVDGTLTRVLEPGRYPICSAWREVRPVLVDMREHEIQIVGQEVMTADKVTIRVNLLVKLQVVDAVATQEAVTALRDAVYSEAQLIARRWVAGLTIDELLEARGGLGDEMRQALEARCATWGARILQLDLKDVVLPGEMKTILNRVIEAEKQAAANNILRREETAATRSMANTAKVLEANPTLLRLKELETIKEIAERIDNVTLVAGGELMNRVMLK